MNGTGFVTLLRQWRIPSAVAIRMAISVAVALVLWGFVTTQQDPITARVFNSLTIQDPGLSDNLLIPVSLGTVLVRVEGPTSLIDDISAETLTPTIDVSGITQPGTYIVPIEISAPAVVDREITPAQLSIIVDFSETRSFPLEWDVEPVDDTSRAVGEISPTVTEVSVTGPESIINRVARVIFEVDIGDRTSSYTDEFDTIALDENGVQIPEVEVRPRRVGASVEIDARGRFVPVLVPTTGSPAEGYDVADRVVSPPAVLLNGPDNVMSDLVSVSTEPVNIEGASEAVTRRVSLTGLPLGVQAIDPRDGQVLVVIQFQQRGVNRTLEDQPVIVGDIPPGYEAAAEPAAIDVVVFVGENAFGDLSSGDVAPRVSVAELGPGTYDLRPAVLVPPDVQWIRTDPATVRVTLRPIATAAEAPTSAPAPSRPSLATPAASPD